MKKGAFIDTNNRVSFNFEGRQVEGFAGDTIATAMWRTGVKTLSRSFKYHRRRGVLSLSGADANTLMDADSMINALADRTLITPNMVVRPRHCWGTLENDKLAILGRFSRFLPPGFYYKAFYKPRGMWIKWEPLIRRLAGLGVVNQAGSLVHVEKRHDFCDVAVIGSGPAGLSAALTAAQSGRKVRLLDKNPRLGGSINWRPDNGDDGQQLLSAVAAEAGIKVLLQCEVTGVFEDNLIAAVQPHCAWRLRAERIIYATGARELPAVFAGNDLPGVMLVSAALRLAFLYDLACGKRAVILASCAADADAVRALKDYGVCIVAVLNMAADDAPWAAQLVAHGFDVRHQITTFAATGVNSVNGACATVGGQRVSFSCDCVLMNAGSIPAAELPAGAGMVFPYDDALCRPVAEEATLAGAVHNRPFLSAAIADGAAAVNGDARPPADNVPSPASAVLWDGKGKAFVDFDEDLQLRDLDDAIDEGFDDIQLLKRYTTAGMGPSQGKLTNINVARHLAQRLGCAVSAVGQVTARPPAAAETLAQLANEEHPIKRTALHDEHVHLSAQFMPAGAWLRPAYYTDAEKEAQAVRQHIGMIDISTLGKMQITGPDAAVLLERLYTGKFQKQKSGTVRYALMLDESGVIADDGVVARLSEERFWVTTTTGNADGIYRQMVLWCARWRLRADIVNMTSAYAAINLAGPAAAALLDDIAGQSISLGYMKAAEIQLQNVTALLLRVGFVGEKGYEIHLPMGHMRSLWKELLQHAQPFGVETQRLLRLEKGHVIVGQDTDGLTTPLEADMGWALGRDKEFYFGQRALDIHRRRGINRQLRGFTMDACWRSRLNEADLVLDNKGDAVGHVTSVAYSPTLDCVVGLAYAASQTPRDGGVLRIRTASGEVMQGQVRQLPFYDPKGEKQQ